VSAPLIPQWELDLLIETIQDEGELEAFFNDPQNTDGIWTDEQLEFLIVYWLNANGWVEVQ
jgi:hypothetical protein